MVRLRMLFAVLLWIPGDQIRRMVPCCAADCAADDLPKSSTTEKSTINPFVVRSSSRCGWKSGKQGANPSWRVDERRPRFRKLDNGKMKSRKTGENRLVASPVAHGLHTGPENRCGNRPPGVQTEG